MTRDKRREAAKHQQVAGWSRTARMAFDGMNEAKAKGLHNTAYYFQKYASRYYAEAIKLRLAIVNKDDNEK